MGARLNRGLGNQSRRLSSHMRVEFLFTAVSPYGDGGQGPSALAPTSNMTNNWLFTYPWKHLRKNTKKALKNPVLHGGALKRHSALLAFDAKRRVIGNRQLARKVRIVMCRFSDTPSEWFVLLQWPLLLQRL